MSEKKKNNTAATIKWVLILVLIFFVVLFAIQNSNQVEVGLVFGTRKVPLSAIMILSFLVGFSLALFLMVGVVLKGRKKAKALGKEITRLEDRLGSAQDKLVELDNDLNS